MRLASADQIGLSFGLPQAEMIMSESIQERTTGPVDQDSYVGGLVHVERVVGLSIETENIDLPESYQPSDGSWAEFVGDVKRCLSRIRDDIKESLATRREMWQRFFHRKHSHRV